MDVCARIYNELSPSGASANKQTKHRQTRCNQYTPQGWGQVLFEVLSQVQVLFHICKYSEYLEDIKYIKYFFNQVQVKYKYFGNKQ